jgi:hypothetical protein
VAVATVLLGLVVPEVQILVVEVVVAAPLRQAAQAAQES